MNEEDLFSPPQTYKKKVPIPMVEGGTYPVEFTFMYREGEAFAAFLNSLEGKDKVSLVFEMASGWGLKNPFNDDNVSALIKKRNGAFDAIFDTYIKSNAGAKLGN